MSVFKRNYRPFTGTPIGRSGRFAAIMRYSLADLWASRITIVLSVLCGIPTLLGFAAIYIANNNAVRMLIASSTNSGGPPIITIDERFFYVVMQGQCWLALVLTAWIGPRLIGLDLANNALPTILSHPISRAEYVMAKLALLVGCLSVVTWVPLLVLFGLQSYLSAQPWSNAHLYIAYGALAGCIMWVMLLALIALAVSSWVRWRIVATAMIFAAVFVPAGTGNVFNAVMRTSWGRLIDIPWMIVTLWQRLLHVQFRGFIRNDMATLPILIALAAIGALCALALNARIRAREVVRG